MKRICGILVVLPMLITACNMGNIKFEDKEVEKICLSEWDANRNGKLSYKEAALVNELTSRVFYGKKISSFNEFEYFVNLEKIGDYAFHKCSNLRNITIPKRVTSIGRNTFSDCYFLKKDFINKSRLKHEAEKNDFWGANYCDVITSDGLCIINSVVIKCVETATNVVIPDYITEIEWGAFEGCTSLSSITIPDGVTYIPVRAFKGCENLSSLTIPDSVIEIGESAFEGCTNLTNLIYSNNIEEIGKDAFKGCVKLKNKPTPKIPKWLYGSWKCRTPYGTINLEINNYTVYQVDKYGFDSGSYDVIDGVLRVKFERDAGIVTTYKLNERLQRIEYGGGYSFFKN